MTVLVAGQGKIFDAVRARNFRVEFVRDWHAVARRWPDQAAGTPFQDPRWLEPWYRAFSHVNGVEPLLGIVIDAASGEVAALVPLVWQRKQGIRVVSFADFGVTDYNMPMLGKSGPRSEAESKEFCRALLRALRHSVGGADLLRLQKMPTWIGEQCNPLVTLGREGSCSLNGNLIEIGDSYEAYLSSIKRIKMPRHWRVFSRYPGAHFKIVTDLDEALTMIDMMDDFQRARMHSRGLSFTLDQDPAAKFYRDLVGESLSDGFAVVTALICDEAIVSATLGIRRADTFVFLRNANAGRRWSHCSPSRLLIERTMAALHARGVRQFDLSIGNYAYKRRFGAQRLPLTDASVALSWKGLPFALRDLAVQRLRRHPNLYDGLGRLMGKPPKPEE